MASAEAPTIIISMRSYIRFVFSGIFAMELLISLMSFSLGDEQHGQASQLLVVLGSGEIGRPSSARSHKCRTDCEEGPTSNQSIRRENDLYCE